MLLVKKFLIHNSRTKISSDKHFLKNASQNLKWKNFQEIGKTSLPLQPDFS